MKLTKTRVERLSLPESGQYFEWDDDLQGFGIRITPGSRSYVVQQRVNGKTRRVTIGKHGLLTAEQARKRAMKLLVEMGDNIDPNTAKRIARARAITLREVMNDYIADHSDLKPSSVQSIRKQIEGLKKPRGEHVERAISLRDWADAPLANITRDKVRARYVKMSKRSVAQANQCFRNLRALWNYARATYRASDDAPTLPDNPVAILSDANLWKKLEPKARRIPDDKIGTVWEKLTELRNDPAQTVVGKTAADIAAFLMLTGVRWSDAAELIAERVNVEKGWWHLPDPKNRIPITLPLSTTAQEILKSREIDAGYLFPARSGDSHVKDIRGVWEKLSEAAGTAISAHDLRRTFVSISGKCGIELWRTKLLMGQKVQDVAIQHYTETSDLRYLATEVQRITDWIEDESRATARGKVVSIRA